MASPSLSLADEPSAFRATRVRLGRSLAERAADVELSSSAVRAAQRISYTGASIVGAIAIAGLAGWAFEIDALKRWMPGQAAINPLVAWCFIALSVALVLLVPQGAAPVAKAGARALTLGVLAVSSLKLVSVFMGWETGVDRWLFAPQLEMEPVTPSRMATRTALGFIFSSSALLCLDATTRRGRKFAEILALLAGTLGLLSIVGYAYGVIVYYLAPNFIPMALPTATAFLILATAILLARVESGTISIVFSNTAGGFVARRLVPLAMLLPVVLGAVRLLGEKAGWYNTALGVAHLASAFIVIFLAAISWTAWLLYRIDSERAAAEAARAENEARVRELNAELERRVNARTAELWSANAQKDESGRLARETLDALSAHIAILDERGTIVQVNQAWRDFAANNTAVPPRTFEGVNYLEVCNQASSTAAEAQVARDFAAGIRKVLAGTRASFAMEYACHSAEDPRWFVGRVTRFAGAGRRMVAIAHEDVTARKQAEESLRFQAHLLKHSGEAAIATNLDGTVIYMNDFAETMYGWPAGEALGRNIMEVTVPEISRREAGDLFTRMCNGESWQGEFLVHRRDGSTFPVSVTNTPLRDENGNVTAIVGMSKDITDRKQAEEALRESEERFRQLAENVQDVFWMVELNYRTTIYVSPAYERIWGRTADALKADPQSFMEPVLPEDREIVDAYIKRQTEGPAEAEYRIRRADGTLRWIHDRSFPVRDENGKVFRIAGIARDISVRKEAQLALRQSEAELRALATRLNAAREEEAARIARELHDELGQAMTGMTMDVVAAQRQLAQANGSAPEEVKRRLAQMRSTLDETIAATRRICTELRPALLDQFGLLPAIEWQVNDFENRSEIFCNLKMCDCDPPITGEPATAIFRILQELLTNVARHAQATEVCVELACQEAAIELIVQDNGRGITATGGQQTLGFGLIGIRERALAVGGRVAIHSEPNRGTRVTVTLPQPDKAHLACGN